MKLYKIDWIVHM